MINIPVEEAQKRLRSVPEELQNAIFSLHNAEIMDKIAEENGLSEKRQRAVAKLVGYVFLGFLDYKDDLVKEIAEAIGAKTEDAKKISDALYSRLFSSLKGELSLAYQPLSAEAKGLPFQIGGISAPSAPAKSLKLKIESGEEKIPVPAAPTTPTTVPTAITSQPSSAIPAGAVAPAFVETTAGKPAVIPVGGPLPPAPPMPTSDTRPATRPMPAAPVIAPTSPTSPTVTTLKASAAPAPVILRQETEFQPLAKQSAKINVEFAPMRESLQKESGKPMEVLKPKAQIEIGGEQITNRKLPITNQIQSSKKFAPDETGGQRVVHYSAWRTPVYAPPAVPAAETATTAPVPAKPAAVKPPSFLTDRFSERAPAAATPTTPPTLITSITATTPVKPAAPAAPQKIADIIAAGKPALGETTAGKPSPTPTSITFPTVTTSKAPSAPAPQSTPPAPPASPNLKRVDYK